ncbi:MAG: hypothetical protein U0470_11615 [Anaerolineae bacterium]
MPNAFLSVSMAAADAVHSDEPALRAESQVERDKAVEDFVTATGWRPKVVKPVAGAAVHAVQLADPLRHADAGQAQARSDGHVA